jgi:putative membrane protein
MKMNRSIRVHALRTSAVLGFASLTSLAFVQCGGDQKAPESPAEVMPSAEPPQPEAADAATTQAAPAVSDSPAVEAKASAPEAPKLDSLSDEQIAAITDAANTAEIAQAKLAQAKSKDPSVKQFAAMMINHHGEAKQKQAKLKLKPVESGVSTAMQVDADSTMNALKADSGKDFDQAYITAQVDGHQKVLDTINDKLLPNVKNADLKAYLEEIKPRVEEHLKQAKVLQHNFDSKRSTVSTSKSSKQSG